MKLTDKYHVRHASGIFGWSALKDSLNENKRHGWRIGLQLPLIRVWKLLEVAMPIDPMKQQASRGPGNSW